MRYLRSTSRKLLDSTPKSHFQNSDPLTTPQSSNPTIFSVDNIALLPVVVIDWMDAVCAGGSEWQDLEDITAAVSNGPTMVRSVGVLLEDCESHVAVIDTIILDGAAGGCVHVIPRGMVVNMHRVWSETHE